MGAAYIQHAKKRMSPALRLEHLEIIFIWLLHLLAHRPDFAPTEDELLDMASYVKFYLDLVASSENISLLYHLSQKGKTVRDPESHTQSVNFYIMCEIAQILIKAHAQANSWLLSSYPGKIRLPSDILRSMPSIEATNQNLKVVFLPDGADGWLSERFKLGGAKEKKDKASVPAKRKAPTTKADGHAKRSRRKRDNGDDDEEEEEVVEEGPEDSDIEMEDAQAAPSSKKGRLRKKNALEEDVPKQSRAERLSARTQAKEKLSSGSKKTLTPPSDGDE